MKLKGLLKVALVLLAISTMFVACDTLAGGKFPPIFTPFTPEAGTVYVQMPETWLGNKAYGAWIWADGGAGSWYDLEVVDESEVSAHEGEALIVGRILLGISILVKTVQVSVAVHAAQYLA